MIKRIHEVLLKDIILLDATKTANSLKKYWFVPLFLFHKRLENLATEIFKLIGNSPITDIQDEFDKLLSYRKLQLLEALYKAVIIEVVLKSRIDAWKILIGKELSESEAEFEKVKAEVLKHTGIELNTSDDVSILRQYIEHKADKYREMYPEIESEGRPSVKLTKVIYSVFNYLSEPYNESMRLITFVEMKEMAEEKIKLQSKSEDNGE